MSSRPTNILVDPHHTEMIILFWEEYKMRHTHYWKTFFKLSIANAFLLTAPFFQTDKICSIQKYEYVFPSLSIVFSLLSVWLFSAEYSRIQRTQSKLNDLKGAPYLAGSNSRGRIATLLSLNIGKVINLMHLSVFLSLATAELIIAFQ